MQNGSPAVTVCYCPNCGTAIWKDFWDSGGEWNIRPQGLHAGLHAGASEEVTQEMLDRAREIYLETGAATESAWAAMYRAMSEAK